MIEANLYAQDLIKTPLLLFLKDSKEIQLFLTINELTSYVEAIDVINEEYESFDAAGRRINLIVDRNGNPTGQAGLIEEDAARALILDYYAHNPRFRSSMSFSELVDALVALYSFGQEPDPPAIFSKLIQRVRRWF